MRKYISFFSLVIALSFAVPAMTGCAAGGPFRRSTGESVDDAAITSRVKAALTDNTEYKFGSVNVTTYKDTVQLSGFVTSMDQKAKAGEIAKKIQGVKNVENNITVKNK